VMVSRPVAEPLLGSRRVSFGVPSTFVTVTRPSSFDDVVEELFAWFDDPWFRSPHRW
jgi:hypothetical protein